MKRKYILPGIVVVALVALWLSFSSGQVGTQGAGDPIAFYGTATHGWVVKACKLPDQTLCFQTTADWRNWYTLHIPEGSDYRGWYLVSDGCENFQAFWNGEDPVRVDFCIHGDPDLCICD